MAPRRRLDPNVSRAKILDATARIISRDGYAAATASRVADEAGIKRTLVHYYYPTQDDLLLAFFRWAAEASLPPLRKAAASERPLSAIWDCHLNFGLSRLGSEVSALSNHNDQIRDEMVCHLNALREIQSEAIARAFSDHPMAREPGFAAAVITLLEGAARILLMEERLGITNGHSAAKKIVETCIRKLESRAPCDGSSEEQPISQVEGT